MEEDVEELKMEDDGDWVEFYDEEIDGRREEELKDEEGSMGGFG